MRLLCLSPYASIPSVIGDDPTSGTGAAELVSTFLGIVGKSSISRYRTSRPTDAHHLFDIARR